MLALACNGSGAVPNIYLPLCTKGHSCLIAEFYLRKTVGIINPVCKCGNAAGAVLNLSPAEHQNIIGSAVIIKRIGPDLLIFGSAMHIVGEKEGFLGPQIPSSQGRKHIPIFPKFYGSQEIGAVGGGFIIKQGGFYKDAVGEHIDVFAERKHFGTGIITAFYTLYNLPLAIAHRRPIGKISQRILGIIVKIMRAEGVVLAVFQLNHPAAALNEVFIYQINHPFAGENGFVLHHLHIAPGIYHLFLNLPNGRVADKIGAIVHKGSVDGAARIASLVLNQFYLLGLDKTYKAVLLLVILSRKIHGGKRRDDKNYCLIFEAHPLREKSHSPKRGSIII